MSRARARSSSEEGCWPGGREEDRESVCQDVICEVEAEFGREALEGGGARRRR